MSWKYVFNTNLNFVAGQTSGEVRNFIKTTGYRFYTFNGLVLDLEGNETGISVDELF